MTVILAPSVVALSLASLVKERGSDVLQKSTPITSDPGSHTSDLLATLKQRWYNVSSLVRFFVSGNLGNICFFFIERSIYSQLSKNLSSLPEFVGSYCETVSFFIGYLLQIVTQHMLHALLVYGLDTINTREKYFKTLIGQFYAYAVALFGSTTLNLFLIQSGIEKTVAFFSTMIIFAFLNYFLISWLVKRALSSAGDVHETSIGSERTVPAGKLDSRRRKLNHEAELKAKASRSNILKKIRRGGAFVVTGSRENGNWSLDPLSIQLTALNDVGDPVDVENINKRR